MNNQFFTPEQMDNFRQFFDSQTLIRFFVIISFFEITDYFKPKTQQWIPNKTASVYVSALLACTILTLLFISFTYIATSISNVEEHYLLYLVLINIFTISLLYLPYNFINTKYFSKLKSHRVKIACTGLVVFILLYLPMASFQLVMNVIGGYAPFGSVVGQFFGPMLAAMGAMIYKYYLYIISLKAREKELQIAKLKQQVIQSQLDSLSAKINPHFLYNSLNSIAALASVDGEKTRRMAMALSKLFKYNLNNDERNFTTIGDEMDMVNLYLDIEKIRFEEKLTYTSYIQPGMSECLIPRNILQPLAENAIKHGSGPNGVSVEIILEKDKSGAILISVKDSGKAFMDINPGYGLKSIYDKLDILTPNSYEIAFFNQPKMVHIQLFNLDAKEV